MPSTFRWGAATHPCRPSGVVHPPGRRTNRCLGRRAGQARTGSLASGIRCTCEQAQCHAQAVQPRRVQPALRYWRPTGPGPANAAEARQSARIPDVSPVPSSLAPRPRTPETGCAASAAETSGASRRLNRYSAFAGAASETISIRQPVSLAASRAFWPSLPIANESW